jgi:beta-N-acetylhexosaminidase
VVERVRHVDVVVVGTTFARRHPGQAEVVNALGQMGKPLIVAGLRDPYDLLGFPQIPCYLAVYGDEEASIDAAAAVIFGKKLPLGRLPIGLPGLYPRGHGLSAT